MRILRVNEALKWSKRPGPPQRTLATVALMPGTVEYTPV